MYNNNNITGRVSYLHHITEGTKTIKPTHLKIISIICSLMVS